jgi:perosamine synthetase
LNGPFSQPIDSRQQAVAIAEVVIPIFHPNVPESVVQRVAETLRGGWLNEGRHVKQFEESFARHFGLPRALALNSGTAALHLAILGAGVQPGDEVILPAQTFVATATAVLQAGGAPVFADLQPGGPNIDPRDLEHRLTPRTKAIIVVHYGGYPCDMDEINALAERHGIKVIEDAAHALGASYRGRPAGALGDFAIFSFQAIKQLTTGDGGMLVCRNADDHQTACRRRWFGIDRANRKPSPLGAPEWDITELGFKYHMNDIAAAMGLAQLEVFDTAQARRQTLNQRYRAELANVPGLSLLEEKADRVSACWLFTVRVERRLEFIQALKSRGVEAAVWHQRIDRNSLFGGVREDLPNQEEFNERQVSLPLRDSLTDDEACAVIRAMQTGW